MKEIQLTQGQVTLVGDEDYDRFNQDPWHATWNPCTKSFYAVRNVRKPDGSRTKVKMHREIMGLELGDPREVDHRNHDTLDNRRENLRVVTCRENHENRRDQSSYGAGVYLEKRTGRFCVKAQVDGKRWYLGTYDTPEEAQQARETFLKEYAA